MRYQGSKVAHQAASVIQAAWREYVLRKKFHKMVDLAKSVENISLSRRLSVLENEDTKEACDDNIDISTSPAARHIQSRRHMRRHNGGHMVKRSTSLRDHRRSGSWSGGFQPIEAPAQSSGDDPCDCGDNHDLGQEASHRLRPSNSWTESRDLRPQTAADLQNKLNSARDLDTRHRDVSPAPLASPVPPCPPLRGRDFYPDQEPIYSFARDSVYCSVRRPRRLPPRPPQRTVSFLGQDGQMTSMTSPASAVPADLLVPHQRPISVSDSSLPRPAPDHMRTISTCQLPVAATCHVSHNRSQSNPTCHNKISPLPPPPYVPPPSVHHRDPNEPLPPPPPSVEIDSRDTRPPCDSVSSIDSGFR